MGVTNPSAVPVTNVDQATDNPRNARADIKTAFDAINTLALNTNALGIMQIGDGLEAVALAGGTKDALRIKLNGGHLVVDASGLAVKDGGITGVKLANGISAPGNNKYYGTNNTGTMGFYSIAASGPQKLKRAVFSTPGTSNWTVPTGVTEAKVTVIGAGGGSGGATDAASGGAGGGCAIKACTGLTPGNNVSVTVGAGGIGGSSGPITNGSAGGTSSFGAFCSATGGAGGTLGSSSGVVDGVAGGIGVGGDLNISGDDSGYGDGGYVAGSGGGSFMAGMTRGRSSANPGSGIAPRGYGGGAGAPYSTGGGVGGTTGAGGVVIVEWVEP